MKTSFIVLRLAIISILALLPLAASPAQNATAAPAAGPLLAVPPLVSLQVPATAFIGENVTFTVTFDNPDPVDPGYGPLIDLIIPTNGTDGAPNPDGLTFTSAAYLGSAIENTAIVVPGSGCIAHPYMMDGGTQAPLQVCGLTPGDTFVALRLPFGSFTPDQPSLAITVNASMSNLADLGVPLTIQARGGYQYGYNPLNDFCCGDDPVATLSNWVSSPVTPTLFTLEKTYSGPEDETATGPNYPRQVTVTAQIAPGQTLSPFTLTDILPDNMQFVSIISPVSGCTLPSTVTPGGTLSCAFASASGTVSMTFSFYIPLRDLGSGSVISPSTGDDVLSCNNASADGTWTPIDSRDLPASSQTIDQLGCEHTLTDKSIATQKGVAVVGGGQPAPGSILEYTLDVQVSDFFVFDQVFVTDTFSDGQRWDTTFTPTLQILGNPATLDSSGNFNAANYTVSPNYTPADPAPNDGTTTIAFRVSDEMISRSADGRLVGGCVPPAGTPGDPDCGAYNNGATTARIVFRTIIQENFSDTFPSGDSSVDQGDVLDNIESVSGRILSTIDAVTPTGFTEVDGSAASVIIGRGTLSKEVYAVNGVHPAPFPVRVASGDTVTFRLSYTLITSDFEALALTDYLPLPIFSATEVTAHNNTVCGVPAAGTSCLGPSDTYHSLPGAVNPAVSNDGVSNWVRWAYGNYDSAVNTASTIDLLFTVTVEDDPFADNMHLTNQAYATEGSTNGAPGEAASIIEITFTAPVMTTTKSAVATNAPAPTFAPALPIAFTPPGSAPLRWGGTINSNLLSTTPIDSDVSGLDAGDLVTFAIFLVNEGSGINGAFDIAIRDTFDAAGFEFPTLGDPNSLNLQIYYGNGSGPISYTDLADSPTTADTLFGAGIKLVDPPSGDGVCQAHDPVSGNNVIVITYDLRLRNDIVPGTYPNTATLTNYSGSEGGPNFLPEPQSDDATVTTDDPLLIKSLVGTELNTPQNSNTQVVIGELLTYTLTLTVPEGILPAAQIVDTLDAGLAFLDLSSVTFSNPDIDGAGAGDDGIYSTVMTFDPGGNCTNCTAGSTGGSNPLIFAFGGQNGRQITFDFGDLVNTNRDNNVDETITITYRAVALNVVGNQSAGLRNNSAALSWTAGSLPVVSAPNVTIIEPVINTAKSVLPTTADAGDTVTFTVTLTNPASGSTTAYDATWSDTLPAALTYNPGTLALGACTASAPLTLSDAGAPTLTGSGGLFQPGESCVITFAATINYSAAPGQVITNTAVTQWTSLSGLVSDRSTYNTDSDERTGVDGVGGALNDYASQGSAAVTINSVQPQKFLVSTSELSTGIVSGTPRVAIGEIVRYRMVVQLPEGSSVNFQIRDNLPAGLTYLNDGTARLALLSNGTPIVSSEPTGSTLGLGLGNGPFATDPWVNGNDPTLVTPAFALPDPNVGSSNSITTDPDAYATGTDTFFKLGTLTNNDSDGDAEYVIIEFNALVDNTGGGSNDAGDNRNNTFSVFISGLQNGSNSNGVAVVIAEPLLTLAKTAAIDPTSDAGDTVTYTLTITSASGNNRATAFDLNLTDAFDANLTGLTVSGVVPTQGATCTGNGSGTTAFSNNGGVFAGNTLTFTATCLDPGQTITLTITGAVAATAPVGYTIPNTATVRYTSLPVTGTVGNPTGSDTPGGSGAGNGERDGSGGAVNDYVSTSSAPLLLSIPLVDKLDPAPAQYVIGDLVTFNILVTLPEGVTPALQVVDDLPAGLEYVSHQVITAAASSDGILASDFNGVLPAPAVTAPGGSGGDLTLLFGDTTTADDNITTNNAFLVRVVARALNIASNQNGTILTNTANVTWTGGSATDFTTIELLEPVLNILKAADDSIWVYGQTVTFTLSLENLAASGSAVDAHDVVITDAIPVGLTYVPASITTAGGCAANDAGAPTLAWTCVSVPLGATINFSYQVTVNSPPTPPFIAGDAIVTNTATTTWTSQPGDNNPGAGDGERDGSGAVNDYSDSDTHSGELVDYYSLGNRVWFDTNNDGDMGAGEQPVPGVLVQLYNASDLTTVLESDVTNAGGFYLFDYLVPGDYVVAVAADNFDAAGTYNALVGYWSSETSISAAGAISELTAPNADTDNTDADDNGTLNGQALLPGAVVAQAVTLGPSGLTEPTGEVAAQLESGVLGDQGAQPDGRANLTVDFGFYRVEIGNLVYRDENANGTFDTGDTLLSGVTVELLSGNGLAVLDTTSTNADGEYEFVGWPEGDYRVRVTTPGGHVSTIDTDTPADTTDPDGEVDNNDNGIGIGPATVTNVTSGQLTMDAGEAGGTLTVTAASGITRDNGLDFGFTYAYALGNRVWFDTDNSSTINGAEVGVNGVTVQLYRADGSGNPTGSVLATDTTVNDGYYLFDNLTAGDYVVFLPASNFGAGAILEGYWSSGTSMDGVGAISEAIAPDPDGAPDVDSDDNGELDLFGSLPGAVASRAVTLGLTGLTELTGESDVNNLAPGVDNQGLQPDGRANMAVDFGFYMVEIGNLVYFDANRDGTYDTLDGDTAMDGANVRLYAADNLTEIPVGPDGILGTSDDATGGVTTSGGGLYLFSGLPEGDYVIRATPSSTGITSTTDAFNQADNDDPDVNADNNDNGDGTAPGQVASAVLTMDAAESAANISVDNSTGSTTDPTVDFGFVEMVALGNRVWLDTGAGAGGIVDDGIQNGTEPGVENVRVELYTSGGAFVAFDTTDANGDYYFDLLYPGAYYVVIPAVEFQSGGDLAGYVSSTGNGLVDDDSDQDVDENGIDEADLAANGIRTPVYTLEPNAEPVVDIDTGYAGPLDDDNVNLTADFGFLQFVALGNRVWYDTGAGADYNNGELDAGETPVDDVTVNLYTSAGAYVATTITANGGYYYFDMLAPGDYYVFIPASEFNGTEELLGYVSSTGDVATENDDEEVDENGIDTHEALNGVRSATYTITPNTEPTAEGQSFYPGFLDDDNVNATLDFGFTQLVAIGNRVWFDTGAGAGGVADDGIQNGAEAGVSGVRVELYTSGGAFVAFDVTDGNGDYYFDMLNPGNYYVFTPGSQFDDASDALYGYVSSTGHGLVDDDDDQNADENGIDETDLPTNGIRTPDYTLSVDAEPIADDDAGYPGYLDDNNVNLTADFGFLQKVAIGNIVWLDNGGTTGIANNGILDGDEAGLDNVTIQLYDSTNTLAASTFTSGGGYYVFDNLLPGSYYLVIPAVEFQTGGDLENLLSSSGNGADETTNETGDENGIDSAAPETTGITSTVFDLQPDSEQTGEPQPNYTGALDDNNVNFTADFGFTELVAIGNRVWLDTGAGAFYNNGILDAGETPVNGVTVELYTAAAVLVDTTTTAGGGYYEFDMLLPGQYYVQIPAAEFQAGGDLEGYVSTTVTGADETSDNDADENGIDVATLTTAGIRTQNYDLQPNSETSAEDQTNYSGALDNDNVNFTADFSFVQLVAIGNRVWFDTGAGGGAADNGIQDGGELGVGGVDVELFLVGQNPATDTPVDTDTTDANGDYEFDLLLPDDYFVHIPADQFDDASDALYGYVSSTGNGADETSDQDADENGIDSPTLPADGISSTPFTLTPNTETIADDETSYTGYLDDDNVNFTADFGFLQFVAIGNRVWLDTGAGAFYNNGILDAGETPVDGVTVELYTAAAVLVDTTTTAGGGYYEFDMLLPGQYYVQIPAAEFQAGGDLEGYVSTTVTGADETSDNDADENGIDVATLTTTGIRTQVYDLQPNSETSTDDQTNYSGALDDDNVNFTADFSFVRLVAIGNRIWFDTGLLGGAPDNGIQDGGELGVGGVDVELFLAGQNPATDTPVAIDTTDAGGNYQFDLLNPGDYFVHIPDSEFQAGGPLEGFFSSTGNGADETSDQDVDENGIDSATLPVDGISSTPFTLTPGTETTADDETSYTGYLDDDNVNFTADFGFLQLVAIGNVVWEDSGAGGGTANNGIQDGAEPGIPGVDLQLYHFGDVPGTDVPVASTTTIAGGYYEFDNLLPGDYFIFIPAAEFQGSATLAGYTSSTGNGNDETSDEDVDENGIDNIAPWTNGITSTNYTLQPNSEPTGEPQPNYTGGLGDSDVNFTADFGFFNSPLVDLGVTKDDGITYYLAGGTLTYEIIVTNYGPIDVLGAVVSDSIPAQIASWNWVCSGATGGATGCDGVAGSNIDFTDTVNLPVGSTITYTVTATVDAAATGPLTNTVIVAPPTGTVDTNPANDEAVDIDEPASLTVTKTNAVSVVAIGTQFTYDIEVTNNGGVALSDLTVVDTLPAEVTFVSALPVPSNVSGSTLTWNHAALGLAGTFNPGASFTIQVTVDVTSLPTSPGGDITNSVTVSNSIPDVTATATHTDVVADNRMKSLVGTIMAAGIDPVTGVVIPSVPDYTTTPEVAIGEILTYQISVDVPAGLTLTNLKALDTMDAGLAFVRCVEITPGSLTTTLPGGFSDACNAPLNPTVAREPLSSSSAYDDGRRVEFTLGDVSATAAETLTITYEVIVLDIPANVDGVGGLNNQVTWSWDGGSLSASAIPVEVVEPELSIEKDATPTVAPYGSTITFTLDIAHTVDSTADAFDVIVTDILPPGLAFIPGTVVTTGLPPTTTTYDAASTTLTFVWNVFPLNETALITFQATFVGPAPVVNTSSVAWTSLPIDPGLGGQPEQISPYNDYSTERWYDPADSSGINNYGVSDTISIRIPGLPETGFAPGRITALPAQSADKQYAAMDGMWLEIPDLGLTMPLTGVPLTAEGWDLTWLSNQAGYLQGTTYPGEVGTMGITSHVTLADGTPGPFRNLGKLFWGNKIILHADGYRYVYEVRDQRTVLPTDLSVFKKDGYTWMTLLTCEGYVPWLDSYNYRLAVRAVLLSVEPDSSVSPFPVRSPSSAPAQRGVDR